MIQGFLFALLACFTWSAIFVVPYLLPDFTPLEVGLGRYFMYGLFSLGLFLRKVKRYPLDIWKKALLFALLSNILYYPPLIIGLRFATAPVTILIASLCPIIIALYGNHKERVCRYRDIFLPSLWILLGIFLVNATEVDWSFQSSSAAEYLLGIAGAICALTSWSSYAIKNARFLKEHPDVNPLEWVTLMGVATLILSLLFIPLCGLIPEFGFNFAKFATPSSAVLRYGLGILFLGTACTWVASYFWNAASTHLPLALMGPMIVFEMVFGLLFVFTVEHRFPHLFEWIGIVAMLWGTLSMLYLFRKRAIT